MNAIVDEQQRIEAALSTIPPDVEREQWWRIAAAIKDELGDGGFDLFDAWSRGDAGYVPADAKDTWRSLQPGRGIRINSLFEIAKKYGFDPRSHTSAHIDPAELERRRAERKARDELEEQKRAKARKHAMTLALTVWSKAAPSRNDHPYLMCKGLAAINALREVETARLAPLIGYLPKANGEPLTGRVLVARIHVGSLLTSLEFIDEAGRKSALAGGAKAGGHWAVSIPTKASKRILIGEGVATVLSAHRCTGDAAVAALSAGNLTKVAQAMREAYQDAEIVILGDIGNGQEKALEAAQAVGGALALPNFGPDRQEDQTDFNDLHVAHGDDAVRRCIDATVVPVDEQEAAPVEAQADPQAGDQSPDDLSLPGLDERPCWRVYEGWHKVGGSKVKPGVYWHGVKPGKNDAPPTLVDKWICTPLMVRATTRNREDAEYGRLLEILSPAGKRKKWAMPMSMLAGDGNEARGVLLSEGLVFDLHDKGAILRYIAGQFPKETMRAASVTGWHDDAFVLPDTVIGADDIWFQASGRTAPYASAGTFEGWRELAALATRNPLLMLAMSSALAGPLLGSLNIDGGGAHLYGDSSSGKTTALLAAISVWGGPAFKRTWRATANGLEGAGSLHSDTLLALDELGEIDPKSLYESAYALINGMGKTRANRHGEARQATRWRVFLLSTGELTIAARMAAGGIEAKAGQELRILDIPVTGAYGLFDDLRGRASGGVLSDEVRNLSAKHYGHAGPRFVEALIRDLRDGLRLADLLQPLVDRFKASEGQERRAARSFAICALAGELSVLWDVTPWEKGEPTKAAMHAFNLWRDRRSTNGQSAEHAAILRSVADFIDKHGDSRFSNIAVDSAMPIRDRAGYWKQDDDKRLYLFTSGGLKEAAKGYDMSRVGAALEKAGALESEAGRRAKTTRTPDGRLSKLYHIDAGKLTEGE
jgi:putative DNA primase/helicase